MKSLRYISVQKLNGTSMKRILRSCKANLLAEHISELFPIPISNPSLGFICWIKSGVFLLMTMKLLVISCKWDEKSKLFSRHFARMNYEPD
jgi:hypothetical protein